MRCRYHLRTLAMPAIGHPLLTPGTPQWMRIVWGNGFDGQNLSPGNLRDRKTACLRGLAIHQHKAMTAAAIVTALFCPIEMQRSSKHRQKRFGRAFIENKIHFIDLRRRHLPPFLAEVHDWLGFAIVQPRTLKTKTKKPPLGREGAWSRFRDVWLRGQDLNL